MHAPGSTPRCVGIDIAAASFMASWMDDAGVPTPAARFAQTSDGFTAFQQQLATLAASPSQLHIVMEATGSYWIGLAVSLHHAGYTVSIINPAHFHSYTRSLPRRGKTDALDAQLLVQFATERHPPAWTPPPAIYHELRQRLMTRDALLELRKQTRNQQHALLQWPVVVSDVKDEFASLLQELDTRITAMETTIDELLHDSSWGELARLLESIPGIGTITAAWIITSTLNFTLCPSADAASAYAGLVPFSHESGTSVRGRPAIGHTGNRRLRTALYMAALTAARCNPAIKPFYDRLRAAGKPMKVARCAAARKLLQLAWAVVMKQQRFDPTYRQQGGGVLKAG